jgi:hypothetical protein
MADRNDRQAQNAGDAQQSGGDDQRRLDEALQRTNEDLAGDIETNRNLSGSTTYETLHEQGDLDVASDGQSDANRRSSGSDAGGSRGSGGSGGMR